MANVKGIKPQHKKRKEKMLMSTKGQSISLFKSKH